MKPFTFEAKWLLSTAIVGLALWSFSFSAKAGIESKPSNHLPISEYEATYVLSWHGLQGGEAQHRLVKRVDGLYHAASISAPYLKFLPFSYTEKTDFAWQGVTVMPHNYFYNIQEGRRHKKGNVSFDWNKMTASNLTSKEPWQDGISPEIQDKLTHAIQLRVDLINGTPKSTYIYTVAEDDEIKPYTFTVLKNESLKTKIGTIETVKLSLNNKAGRETHMWLSKEHEYLPVKLEHFKEGKQVGSGEIKSYAPLNNG